MNKELEFFNYFYITISVFLHLGQYARLTKCTFINQRNKHKKNSSIFSTENFIWYLNKEKGYYFFELKHRFAW